MSGRARSRGRGRSRNNNNGVTPTPGAMAANRVQTAGNAGSGDCTSPNSGVNRANADVRQPGAVNGAGSNGVVPNGVVPNGVGDVVESMGEMRVSERENHRQPSERGRRRGGLTDARGPRTYVNPTNSSGNTSQSAPIQLTTNCFSLVARPEWTLYQYHVDFNPEVESRRIRLAMVHQLGDQLAPTRMFDGMQLFMTGKLEKEVTEFITTRQHDGEKILVRIKLVSEFPAHSPTALMLFGIIFRKELSRQGMIQIGRHYYDQEGIPLPGHNLQLLPGFTASILALDGGIMLNIDRSYKILRRDTAYDVMYELYRSSHSQYQEKCRRQLLGAIVMTRYNNKTYRVTDIDFDSTPQSSFDKRDNTSVTYVDYYRQSYNIGIEDLEQPLLVTQVKDRGEKKMALLIPELCYMTGMSDSMLSDFNLKKDMSSYTRPTPVVRERELSCFVTKLNSGEEGRSAMEQWGLKFEQRFRELSGRVLPAPMIHQGLRASYVPREGEWSREMRNKALLLPVKLTSWLLIASQREHNEMIDFLTVFKKIAPPLGILVADPKIIVLPNSRSVGLYIQAIRENVTEQTNLATIIVPSDKKDLYDAIKKMCCVECPVNTQVIRVQTLRKKTNLMSVVTKIAVQINSKLGGEAWAVEGPKALMMAVGIDVYHDSGETDPRNKRSVLGFCGSLNANMTRYYTQVAFHGRNKAQEIADNLTPLMSKQLHKFREERGELPSIITVIRDGVGDGQIPDVVDHEIPQFKESFRRLECNYNPKLIVLVVTKRINTRFFCAAGHNGNPPPGTLVDHTVTRPEWYDFYLVPQAVRQGTVTPTHYNVVYDTLRTPPHMIQNLMYKLCHLYYNWSGTVRVPAPCQYAHKVAYLVGVHIHAVPHPSLANKLYYL